MGQLVSRRALLRGGVAVGAALGLAATIKLPAAGEGRLVMSEVEAAIVAAIAITYFPGVHMPLDGVQAGVVEEVDRHLVRLRPVHRHLLRYMFRAIEWGAVASHGRRFTQLDPDERRDVLEAWGHPDPLPRRVASDSLRMVMAMAYFSSSEILDHMGYRALCGGGYA